jgi:two-component system, LytTR family, sensor kinase
MRCMSGPGPADALSSGAQALMKMPTLEQVRSNRNVLFWSLHAAGWAAYGITQYLGALFYEKPSSYARVWLVAAFAGFVLSAPMRYIYRRLWGRAPRTMIIGVLATCYVTALALRMVINLSYREFVAPDWQMQTLFELFGGSLSTAYLLVCWSVLYFGIKFYESQRQQEQALLKAVALAQEAQLKMLRYQWNPHFLFNTLNAIAALVPEDPFTAEAMLVRLGDLLRTSLDSEPSGFVTLRTELKRLASYVELQRMRFGDRLCVAMHADPAALNARVPSFLLQPLVENAISHGIAPRRGVGHIDVEATCDAGRLRLFVRDDGIGLPPESERRERVGLGSTRARLAAMFPDKSTLELSPVEPRGTLVSITVPFEIA